MGQSPKITLFLAFSVFIGQFGWTCGQEDSIKHYTSYGEPCKQKCGKHESEYFWCTTETGWDYCSKTQHTDYKYDSCRDDHPCGKYGKSYTWCYNKAGGWGYCGLLLNTTEPRTLSYISSKYQRECRDECLYDEKSQYFWCNTDKGWDFCSPLPSLTYKNELCRSDHSCGAHGYRYNWCWTNSGYDYCGVIKLGECQYSITGYNKDESNVAVLLCTQWSRGNKLETRFYIEPVRTGIGDSSPWRNELTSLIARWNNNYLSVHRNSHVITTENLQIDLQGLVRKDDWDYYVLEILANAGESSKSGNNLMVAKVLVPFQTAVPSRYIRMAFAESFRRRRSISLHVMTGQ